MDLGVSWSRPCLPALLRALTLGRCSSPPGQRLLKCGARPFKPDSANWSVSVDFTAVIGSGTSGSTAGCAGELPEKASTVGETTFVGAVVATTAPAAAATAAAAAGPAALLGGKAGPIDTAGSAATAAAAVTAATAPGPTMLLGGRTGPMDAGDSAPTTIGGGRSKVLSLGVTGTAGQEVSRQTSINARQMHVGSTRLAIAHLHRAQNGP
mmetsp:Transcript_117448/g.292818  ORF Transcript_117448/g.292818 Transcript_117448/m.292818 type:complete len:210 (+) Transcript_117448:444-1073(+)